MTHFSGHTHVEDYDFIFIHIPKCAGTTMRTQLDYSNVVQHRSAWLIRDCMANDLEWQKRFKFAFVRNPWDRAVSWYHYYSKWIEVPSFEQWVKEGFKNHWVADWNHHKQPDKHPLLMSNFVTDVHGNLIVDFIGRYENLKLDWIQVCERLGRDSTLELPCTNTTNYHEEKHYRDYYDHETIEKVRTRFQQDIELFGYEF